LKTIDGQNRKDISYSETGWVNFELSGPPNGTLHLKRVYITDRTLTCNAMSRRCVPTRPVSFLDGLSAQFGTACSARPLYALGRDLIASRLYRCSPDQGFYLKCHCTKNFFGAYRQVVPQRSLLPHSATAYSIRMQLSLESGEFQKYLMDGHTKRRHLFTYPVTF
jgi:hypothetical protein